MPKYKALIAISDATKTIAAQAEFTMDADQAQPLVDAGHAVPVEAPAKDDAKTGGAKK